MGKIQREIGCILDVQVTVSAVRREARQFARHDLPTWTSAYGDKFLEGGRRVGNKWLVGMVERELNGVASSGADIPATASREPDVCTR